jgi:hypothetical protein
VTPDLASFPVAHLTDAFSLSVGIPMRTHQRFTAIKERIPGWSTTAHLAFFDAVVRNPAINDVLVCGVYHGLDLALLANAATQADRTLNLTGVDLFSAEPCADWPEAKRGQTWQQAGFGEPPSMAAARQNAPVAVLVRGDSATFLRESGMRFDFIWLDTSHDAETVRGEIHAAKLALRPNGLLAGDDYTGPDAAWGVEKVVKELLPSHGVFFSRIWFSNHPLR